MAQGKRLKLDAHDASRIEWSCYLPLPPVGEGVAEVECDVEVAENFYAHHDGWDQLQLLARLSSPDEDLPEEATPSLDGVRRSALARSRRLKLLRDQLSRAWVAHSLGPNPLAPVLARELEELVAAAVAELGQARAALAQGLASDGAELRRERELADEFLSGQLLELLTAGEEISTRMSAPLSGRAPAGFRAVALKLRRLVASALAAELEERARRRHAQPAGDDPEALIGYLERAAHLKKHFQEVLFLEPEATMVDQEWRNLVGLGGAATAFVGWFALQAALQSDAVARAGLGFGTVIALGAAAYAVKDRMKELTRQWISGRLSNLYANRVLKLRAPARLAPGRPVVLQARESFGQDRVVRPDPLHPESGVGHRVVVLRYRLRAKVKRPKELAQGSALGEAEQLKLVFRYDLAPLLTRLDDSLKRVPVPAAGRARVRFAEAPRVYRVPVRVRVVTGSGAEARTDERRALVRLQRGGIESMTVLAAEAVLEPASAVVAIDTAAAGEPI